MRRSSWSAELAHGSDLLRAKLAEYKPRLVIFTFKRTAEKLFGGFAGKGFAPGLEVAGSQVFVMPGPYEKSNAAAQTLQQLAACFEAD